MTRKNKRQTNSSTWLWGTEGTGAVFVKTKIRSLAAKGFGSFLQPLNPINTCTSESPTLAPASKIPTPAPSTSDTQTAPL